MTLIDDVFRVKPAPKKVLRQTTWHMGRNTVGI